MKTERFADPAYVGDPLNAVKIFNEKEVDELCLLDITATAQGAEPDLDYLSIIADECRMPLTYGGGVKSSAVAEALLNRGVEKIAIGAAAAENPRLLSEIASRIGRQSVVAIMNVRRDRHNRHEVSPRPSTCFEGASPKDVSRVYEDFGAGELLVNSVDRDGTREGYDIELASAVRSSVSIPLTIVGGARSTDDMRSLHNAVGPVGAGVGSLFVYRGRFKAVLISYERPWSSWEDATKIAGRSSSGDTI